MRKFCLATALLVLIAIPSLFAQETETVGPFSTVGIGFRASDLGLGAEVATPIVNKLNLRAGFNLFNYSASISENQVNYNGTLQLRSVETHVDWFPFGGSFHLSPGVMLYNGNKLNASITETVHSQPFTWNGDTYTPSSQVTGSANLSLNSVAPTLMFGFGNLVPRKRSKHFSVSVEAGVAFQGSPKIGLGLTQGALTLQNSSGTTTTFNVNGLTSSGSPLTGAALTAYNTLQNDVKVEQTKLQNDATPFKYYPIISLGFGYRF
jgi:hypothetical protein